jgi:uncharacterized protein YdaU (DUF1376 family)
MSGIGHNSASFEELLPKEDWLASDRVVQFRFIDLHLGDWLGGLNGLSCEIEGAYIRFLVRLYQHGKPFQDDDRELAARMNMSIRVWRRLRDELVSRGKIVSRNGCLTNKRFEEERLKRSAQIKKQADAARGRWQKQRTSDEVFAETHQNFSETSTKISENSSCKTSKINELSSGQPMPPFSHTHSHTQKEEDNTPPPSVPVAGGARVEEVTGLNGATVLMVETLAAWMCPMMPKRREAREWLGNTVQIFGSDVVKSAFADMQAKHAHGDIVARPIPLMTKICQRKEAEAKSRREAPLPAANRARMGGEVSSANWIAQELAKQPHRGPARPRCEKEI